MRRILALNPKRVLEVGCGTGLLLFRIASLCEKYVGTDPSSSALRNIGEQLTIPGRELPQVSLLQRMGDNFAGIEPQSFDTVILNSVAHHFPSINYMARFLDGAVNATRPGGKIFIGDVRNFALLEAFHASVQFYRASSVANEAQLRESIDKSLLNEDQLLIDPRFFRALRQQLPQISAVEIKLKRGYNRNEITRFRYDAILHVGIRNPVGENYPTLDWQRQKMTMASLQSFLATNEPESLVITGVPNARVHEERQLAGLLANGERGKSVHELRALLNQEGDGSGIEPEDFWVLADHLPYRVDVTWLTSGGDGCYDVLFRRRTQKAVQPLPIITEEFDYAAGLSGYANNPLRWKSSQNLLPELRSWLKQKLPEHMIPSAFVVLERLPLTSNGKVDRGALPVPDQTRRDLQGSFVAPRNAIERVVAEIWSSILRLERIGIHDDFLELGGHSLLATQIMSRLREAFSIELPLRMIFESPTVAELANEIELLNAANETDATPLRRVSRDLPLPLSFAQQRLWFLDQLVPGKPVYNAPNILRLIGSLDFAALLYSLNQIIERHEILRTTFATVAGKPTQVVAEGFKLPLPLIDLSSLSVSARDAEVHRLANFDTQKTFDLARGPLIRATLLRLNEHEHILLLTMHHIICDGWSMRVLLDELATLYQSFSSGKSSHLPELPIQYADYAAWQREWATSTAREKELSYWKQQLAGAPAVLELATDKPRPALESFRGGREILELPESLSRSLHSLSQREGVTLFMTMLAAFAILLHRHSGQHDILIGTAVVNRPRTETENLIGLFLNNLVLRSRLSDTQTFVELLRQTRDMAVGAYAHQDLPFENLVEELRPDRAMGRTPLVQVFFELLSYEDKVELPWSLAPTVSLLETWFKPDEEWSKFDLTLYAIPHEQKIDLVFVYSEDLFEAPTIRRMLQQFDVLLADIVSNPNKNISLLSLSTESEKKAQVANFNEDLET